MLPVMVKVPEVAADAGTADRPVAALALPTESGTEAVIRT
jgi:hypothetical protein